jgi:hypothetical protein
MNLNRKVNIINIDEASIVSDIKTSDELFAFHEMKKFRLQKS